MRSPNSVVLNGVPDEDKCSFYCSLNENCIFYAYSETIDELDGLYYGSCVLKSKLDISAGINPRAYVTTKSVKSKF